MIRATPHVIGGFFALAASILVAAGIALTWPGTVFDAIWTLRPSREALLMPYRALMGPAFLALAAAMAAASAGSFARLRWGWRLAIVIFIFNALGDATQLLMGHFAEGATGVAATGLILYWLTRPPVRAMFA